MNTHTFKTIERKNANIKKSSQLVVILDPNVNLGLRSVCCINNVHIFGSLPYPEMMKDYRDFINALIGGNSTNDDEHYLWDVLQVYNKFNGTNHEIRIIETEYGY